MDRLKFKLFLSTIFALTTLYLSSQDLPYEEKAKYEKFLSQKVEEAVIKILGPNQVKVIVETTMDFTKVERIIYDKNKEKKGFDTTGAGDVSGIEYIMPGFGLPRTKEEDRSYSKEIIFPSTFIKKIKVTALVNNKLSDEVVKSINSIITEVLNLNKQRGDEVVVIKSEFAPIWKTIWYDPQSMNFIIKYIILSILGIITLIIVSIALLKLAGAMSTMAKIQQTHNITMELSGANAGGLTQPSSPAALVELKQEREVSPGEDNRTKEKIYFDIKPHQVDALVNLMINEDPANVSIVVDHLRDDIKEAFFKKLPQDFAVEIIAHLSKIRFMDQDEIMTLKDELESRLNGAVGGINEVISSLKKLDHLKKMKMIETMKAKHPQLVSKIFDALILPQHLFMLDENSLSILISSTSMDDWTNIYSLLDESFKEKFNKQISDTARKIMEEKLKYTTPSDALIEKSLSNIMEKFNSLIVEGRIKKPEINILSEIESEDIFKQRPL